jgi:hypothetical protein
MKKIVIKGKRNIDGIKGEKEKTRKITSNVNKKVFNKISQVEYLNKLYLGENYDGIDFVKKEVERKLSGYKNQDVKKRKLSDKLISYEECLEKLVISKLKCYYCKTDCLLTYENVREQSQWTLDRIDNSIGHEKDNVVICCLKCNLKRRTTDDEKFKFTKQMRIIKTF